jgi:hypothetical protein
MPSEPTCHALARVGLLMTMGGPADRRKDRDRPPASQVVPASQVCIRGACQARGPARRGWLPLECPPGADTTTPIGTSHHHQEPEANSGRGEGTAVASPSRLKSTEPRWPRGGVAGRSRNPSSSWRAPSPSALSGMLGPS